MVVWPPVKPTRVLVTPGTDLNAASTPQKHPAANVAFNEPPSRGTTPQSPTPGSSLLRKVAEDLVHPGQALQGLLDVVPEADPEPLAQPEHVAWDQQHRLLLADQVDQLR